MFDRLKGILTGTPHDGQRVSEVDNEKRLQVATAVILLEVAQADEEYSESEQDSIMQILKDQFNLDSQSVQEILHVSEEQQRKSIDLWHFTEIINRNYNTEEKCCIIEKVWQVIYADGKLDKYEDHIVHKLARILNLSHEQMIEAKMKHLPDVD
jgi:uncharacterized tellurite resistance protein B-like protein